jgi:hypothetical protein
MRVADLMKQVPKCIILLLASMCLAPASAAVASPGHGEVTHFLVCDAPPWESSQSCRAKQTHQLDPQGRLLWVSGDVHLGRDAALTPLAVFISSMASSAIYWDGKLIGFNGRPSPDPKLEQAGLREAAIVVPERLASPGFHKLTLQMSSGLSPVRLNHPVIRVRVAPYEAPLEPVLREYLFAITAIGALLMCALYFGFGSSTTPQFRTGRYQLAASLSGIAQLAAEASRAVIAYEYPAQVVRVSLVLAFAVAFSFALIGYVAGRFRPSWLTPMLAAQGTSTAAAILLAPGFDQKTAFVIMSAAALSAAASLDAMRRGIVSGAPLFAAFAACVLLAALAPETFLDRDLYLWMVVLFGGLAAEQARHRPPSGATAPLASGTSAGAEVAPCSGLMLGSGASRHFVMPGHIIRLASADDYTEVFLVGGRSLLHPEPLDRLVKRLSGSLIRVHRSHAINVAHLRTFTIGQNSLVVLSDDSTAPVSRRRLQAVKAAVGGMIGAVTCLTSSSLPRR